MKDMNRFKPDQDVKEAFWPIVTDATSAKKAVEIPMALAGVGSLFNALAATFGWMGFELSGGLLVAMLLGLAAFGLSRMSRTAAVSYLLLAIVDVVVLATTRSYATGGAAIFLLFPIKAVRGTFAYHRIRGTRIAKKNVILNQLLAIVYGVLFEIPVFFILGMVPPQWAGLLFLVPFILSYTLTFCGKMPLSKSTSVETEPPVGESNPSLLA